MVKKQLNGFTLIELMIIISIIGILATIATPIYKRYVNEAKATDLLIHIHEISMLYIDALNTGQLSSSAQYKSSSEGLAPPAFSGRDALYSTKDGFNITSIMQKSTNGYIPSLIIKSTNANNKGILHALNHILKQKHAFLSPEIMIVVLSDSILVANNNHAVTLPHQSSMQTNSPSGTKGVSTSINVPMPVLITHKPSPTGASSIPTPVSVVIPPKAQPSAAVNPVTNSLLSTTVQTVHPHSQVPPYCARHPGWLKNHHHGC
jgi:prepilin-type N-terminal cleavage/methylation domain-containing protein